LINVVGKKNFEKIHLLSLCKRKDKQRNAKIKNCFFAFSAYLCCFAIKSYIRARVKKTVLLPCSCFIFTTEDFMKIITYGLLLTLVMVGLCCSSCRRNSDVVWDDTKTAGRHVNRGMRALGGKHGDSRVVRSREDFMYPADGAPYIVNDFVPLSDDPNVMEVSMADMVNRPPRECPGDPGSAIPAIDAFCDPSTNPRLAGIFRNIHFEYNSTLVKGDDNLMVVRNVADYMRQSPHTYLFLAGHCDERGTEAYNLALGSNRSHAVRNLLISEGVNPDNIFTTSYGRERPLVQGHDEESWTQNRRVEFKVYER
jgi:peptidoglycan-associated lipoprotein